MKTLIETLEEARGFVRTHECVAVNGVAKHSLLAELDHHLARLKSPELVEGVRSCFEHRFTPDDDDHWVARTRSIKAAINVIVGGE